MNKNRNFMMEPMSKIRMGDVNEGDRALLNPESTDYNSCQ